MPRSVPAGMTGFLCPTGSDSLAAGDQRQADFVVSQAGADSQRFGYAIEKSARPDCEWCAFDRAHTYRHFLGSRNQSTCIKVPDLRMHPANGAVGIEVLAALQVVCYLPVFQAVAYPARQFRGGCSDSGKSCLRSTQVLVVRVATAAEVCREPVRNAIPPQAA
jgi:hypothetical protein